MRFLPRVSSAFAAALAVTVFVGVTATTADAERRQLSAHEHGVSKLQIAQDGRQVLFVLETPGADIVGFEHEPENAAQKKAVNAALKQLRNPMNLFVVPSSAGCTVSDTKASFNIEDGDDHSGHDHSAEAKKDDHDHDHGATKAAKKDDHDHDHDHDHGAKKAVKDDHDHDHDHGAKKAAKDDHDHDHSNEAKGGSHAEFAASWTLTCDNPADATKVTTTFFSRFPNAKEINVEAVGPGGQTVQTLTPGDVTKDLSEVSG
ncbi:MAG: DUF2796 domain-containing protein [Pseudomonadota bacterium]